MLEIKDVLRDLFEQKISVQIANDEIQIAHSQETPDCIHRLRAMNDRWKSAIEDLTPQGSEYVDDPERCAEAIRDRCQWPKMIIRLRVQLASLRKDKDMAVHLLRKWKAWWPEPYGNVSEMAFWLDVDEFLAAIDKAEMNGLHMRVGRNV